jgi:hypothetical protein
VAVSHSAGNTVPTQHWCKSVIPYTV